MLIDTYIYTHDHSQAGLKQKDMLGFKGSFLTSEITITQKHL